MKSDVPRTPSSQDQHKYDFVIYLVTVFGASRLMFLLCHDLKLHSTVLLSLAGLGIGSAVYYGLFRKALEKSIRRGLSILFLIITTISMLLYSLILRTGEVAQWNFPVELFGTFVIVLTVVFIYKHGTSNFWKLV